MAGSLGGKAMPDALVHYETWLWERDTFVGKYNEAQSAKRNPRDGGDTGTRVGAAGDRGLPEGRRFWRYSGPHRSSLGVFIAHAIWDYATHSRSSRLA